MITYGTDIVTVEQAIFRISPQTPVDELAEVIGKLEWLGRRVKELKGLFEDVMLARIQESGEVEVNGIRYYAGHASKTTCVDVPATVNALLEASGGDVAALATCLCSQPILHGAAKGMLPTDVAARLFRTETKVELKEGQPRKRLLKFDPRFVKGETR